MKTKGNAPKIEFNHEVRPEIAVYYQFYQLKQLYRQGWLQAGVPADRCETVAEHSLGVVLLTAMLGMGKHKEDEIDLTRALLMALFHDFGEIYAGDFTPNDQISGERKHSLELDAVQRVFGLLEEGTYILSLWEEYEAGETAEAKFVRELDRLEMGLQACVYQGTGLLEKPESFIDSMVRSVS
ncbi:MAG: HD domain-containing protein, partial [Anaerolineaceae bacterium]|nr:HD domain-containing protein [Anaerolineaceae bacterium]